MKRSEMFYRGYEHGADAAINACFGGSSAQAPCFETADEEFDYWHGYELGYASID